VLQFERIRYQRTLLLSPFPKEFEHDENTWTLTVVSFLNVLQKDWIHAADVQRKRMVWEPL
jgi:hypothetical protein